MQADTLAGARVSDFSDIVFEPDWAAAGVSLVEAGAGTGKTYNIQNLYLRLVVAQGLKVQEILVVTFTEAATHELRQRLRLILVKCRDYLEGRLADGDPECDRVSRVLALADGVSDGHAAERQWVRVRLALTDFDQAAIFTIHGFCQRILDRYAFACGHDPEAELLPDARALVNEVCHDWWRRQSYGSAALARRLPFRKPAELTALVRAILKRPDAVVLPAPDSAVGESTLFARLLAIAGRVADQEAAGDSPWKLRLGKPVAAAVTMRDALAALRQSAGGDGAMDGRALRTLGELDVAKALAPKKAGDFAGLADLLEAVRQHLVASMAVAGQALAETVRRQIRDGSLMTYDTMLTRVRDSLHGVNGPALVAALRGEFRAAMVDEFQDTDPVQYAIFRTIFRQSDEALPLLYVGDPKQAIYGFRNGDIFTYYAASHAVAADRRYRLSTNYRSEPALVQAVNAVFADDSAGDGAFLNPAIRYDPLTANGVKPDGELLENGQPDATPLRLWRYTADGTSRLPGMTSECAQGMYVDVAEEIVRLLSDAGPLIGARAVSPSDIAVLVMTHNEAEWVQQALLERGLNVERQNTGNVFDTDEARQMGLVMQAMLMPRDPAAVRAALCTGLLPCTEAQVRDYADDPGGGNPDAGLVGFDDWLERFYQAGERWRRGSFIQAFRFLAARAGIRAHLLQGRDGLRRVTNVWQMAELAHQASMGMQLAPPGLFRWFVRQLDKDRRDPDDERCNIRPASDDEAVKIMTVFKSKGLEFPIVFVPTLWRRQSSGRGHGESWLAYHGAATAGGVAPLVLNLDTGDGVGVAAAQAEREQEDVRLAYVALTRAVNRCYLLALDGCGASTALQRLIGRLDGRAAAAGGMETFGICQESGPLFAGCSTRWVPSSAPSGHGESAERCLPTPVIPLAGGHASFSSLMPHDGHAGPDAGVKDIDAADRDAGVAGAAGADLPADETSIFAIAGGAKTGNCWHDIFETIDFQGPRSAVDAVVDSALDRDGICGWPLSDARVQGRRQAVKDMVRRVLTAPLPDGFRLCEVPMQARRSELAFNFTLRQHGAHRTMRDIYDVIDTHWRGPARDETFLERLRGVGGSLPQGFMTGYIDLVFEYGGRFYIVDWKSNRIGGTPAHFDAAGLAGEMALHGYYLQYLIYIVALDAFLRQRLAGYDYETHFGGVYYVFLRGVDETVPARGLFHERPAAELIATLSHVMAAGA